METKKFNLNWQSVLVGMVLCLVLVVFAGSKAAGPQTGAVKANVLQRGANMNDLWEKTNAVEERLVRIEQKVDALGNDLSLVLKVVKKMYREDDQK